MNPLIQPEDIFTHDQLKEWALNNGFVEDKKFDVLLYKEFIELINDVLQKKYRGDTKSKKQFLARIKEGVMLDDWRVVINNFALQQYHIDSGFNYLTPEFFTRSDKIEKGLNLTVPKKPIDLSKVTYR